MKSELKHCYDFFFINIHWFYAKKFSYVHVNRMFLHAVLTHSFVLNLVLRMLEIAFQYFEMSNFSFRTLQNAK